MNRKRPEAKIPLHWKAHIEEIGELEGKKALFEDILVFSKEIWGAITCKGPGDFRLDFQVLLSLQR